MPNLNMVVLAGNLTRDPEIRYAPSGDAVGDLQLAVNRTYRTRDGQDREETCFVGIVVWGRQAETCGQYLHKGSPVLVEGRLQFEQWEKDGQKNSRLRVRANRVQFLGGRRDDAETRGGGAPQPSATAGSGTADYQSAPPSTGSAPPMEDDDNLPF